MYGNSGISLGQLHGSRPNDYQTGQAQSVHKVLCADACEAQPNVPGKSSGPGDDVSENCGDLRVGQFLMRYLERHEPNGGPTGREQDQNINGAAPLALVFRYNDVEGNAPTNQSKPIGIRMIFDCSDVMWFIGLNAKLPLSRNPLRVNK